jgi:hypothetical protein
MRLEIERKLFVGLRIDNKMREQLANVPPRDKSLVDGTNPDYLLQLRGTEDTYIGKLVEAGSPAASMEDLRRNILSILNRVAPGRHREDAIKVFAVDEGEPPPLARDKEEEDERAGRADERPGRYRDYY